MKINLQRESWIIRNFPTVHGGVKSSEREGTHTKRKTHHRGRRLNKHISPLTSAPTYFTISCISLLSEVYYTRSHNSTNFVVVSLHLPIIYSLFFFPHVLLNSLLPFCVVSFLCEALFIYSFMFGEHKLTLIVLLFE